MRIKRVLAGIGIAGAVMTAGAINAGLTAAPAQAYPGCYYSLYGCYLGPGWYDGGYWGGGPWWGWGGRGGYGPVGPSFGCPVPYVDGRCG